MDGYELLDLDQMWGIFVGLNPDCLERDFVDGTMMIRWRWLDRDGAERSTLHPYTPQGLKTLIDNDFFA